MSSVLTTAQAHEVFFASLAHVYLLYRPYTHDKNLKRLQELAAALYAKIGTWTYPPMLALTLRLAIDHVSPKNLEDASEAITAIPNRPTRVERSEIEGMADVRMREALLALCDSTANELRNAVVHKQAHRPTLEEAESCFKAAEKTLHRLNGILGGLWSFEHYANQSPEP
jgi:hypothetical protein